MTNPTALIEKMLAVPYSVPASMTAMARGSVIVVQWGPDRIEFPDPPGGPTWTEEREGYPNPIKGMREALGRRVHGEPVLLLVPELVAALCSGGRHQVRFGRRWRLALRIATVAAGMLPAQTLRDPRASLVLTLVHRARFVLATFPFRVLGSDAPEAVEVATFAPGALGASRDQAANSLAVSARKARELWYDLVRTWEDHPALTTINLEQEARALVWTDADERTELLRLGEEDDQAVTRQVVREVFTSRFMLRDADRAVAGLTPAHRWAGNVIVGLGVAAVAAAVTALVLNRFDWAQGWWHIPWPEWAVLGLGVTMFLAILVAALFDEALTYPIALRFAASSVIGGAAMIAIPPEWADAIGDSSRQQFLWLAVFLLLGAAFGYLIVEATLHGLNAAVAVRRAALVLVWGLTYGLIVATALIFVLGPVFIERWSEVVGALSPTQGATAVFVVAVTVATLGVYLQILWDDRPVTYPLSSLRLRARR